MTNRQMSICPSWTGPSGRPAPHLSAGAFVSRESVVTIEVDVMDYDDDVRRMKTMRMMPHFLFFLAALVHGWSHSSAVMFIR